MSNKRMFSTQMVDSDAFLEMPLSSQALYFHLGMRADDDGFLNNPIKIQRSISASSDDMKVLIAKKFIIAFESGIIVIKHWKINNSLRADRYKPTIYQLEFSQLTLNENGAYSLSTTCKPLVNQVSTVGMLSIDKVSIDKSREDKNYISFKDDDILFEEVWISFGKYGNKKIAVEYWKKLTLEEKQSVKARIPVYKAYLARTGFSQKMLEGWINPKNRIWETTYENCNGKQTTVKPDDLAEWKKTAI